MIKRGNMKDAILQPGTHAERLVVAEQIVREVLAEHSPGRVYDDGMIKRITQLTLVSIETSIETLKGRE